MKNKFREFRRKTQSEYKAIWKDALIVFDTNAFLEMYNYSLETEKEMEIMMLKLGSQLWMPYQVGKEFYKNRKKAIQQTHEPPEEVLSFIQLTKEIYQKLSMVLDKTSIKSPFHNSLKTAKDASNTISSKLSEDIKKITVKNKKDFENDKIADFIENLFLDKTGDKLPMNETSKFVDEYWTHINKKTYCVGYMDQNKCDNAPGDYFIWKELLAKAKRDNKNIIFVTLDVKQDWWEIKNGIRLSPRSELVSEFYIETGGKDFIMYELKDFLDSYPKYTQYEGIQEEAKHEINKLSEDFMNRIKEALFHPTEVPNIKPFEFPKPISFIDSIDESTYVHPFDKYMMTGLGSMYPAALDAKPKK